MSRTLTFLITSAIAVGGGSYAYGTVADGAEVAQVKMLTSDATEVGEALRLDAEAAEDPSTLTCPVDAAGVINLDLTEVHLQDSAKSVTCWVGVSSDGEPHVIVDATSTDLPAGWVGRYDSSTGATTFYNGAPVTDIKATLDATETTTKAAR